MSYHTKYIKSTSSFMKKTDIIVQNNDCLLCYSKIDSTFIKIKFWDYIQCRVLWSFCFDLK